MKFENRIESTSFFLLSCVTILSAQRIIPLVESRVDRYHEEISDFFLSIKSSKAIIFEEREKKETNKNFDSYFFAYKFIGVTKLFANDKQLFIESSNNKKSTALETDVIHLPSSQRQISKGGENARLSFISFIRLFILPLETLLRIK